MKKSTVIFGEAHKIVEETRKPRLIAKRIGENEIANKNKAKVAKKVNKNSKDLNHNHTKHL